MAALAEALGMEPDTGPPYFHLQRSRVSIPDHDEPAEMTMHHKVDPDEWHRYCKKKGVDLFVVGQTGDADAVDAVVAVHDGWAMKVRFRPAGDHVEVVEVAIRPKDPDPDPIGATMLRGMGFGAVLDEAEKAMRDFVVAERFLGERWPGPVKRPGRAGKSDVAYVVWAKRYVDALEVAPRSPIKKIVDDLVAAGESGDSFGGVTTDKVRALVNEAKNRGLLTRSEGSGVPGGELTEKCKILMDDLGMEV